MDRIARKKLRYYLRLSYPLEVCARSVGYVGRHPDLPGCEAFDTDPKRLYSRLQELRELWLAREILAGRTPPMPNSYLTPAPMPMQEETTAV